mmetsp:Transcript_75143/g.244328  ORF Transcript_75143/g.244328 Transcript_75143/m.244328 type:complete len:212 (-) Transcript_75143:386-1021(-)
MHGNNFLCTCRGNLSSSSLSHKRGPISTGSATVLGFRGGRDATACAPSGGDGDLSTGSATFIDGFGRGRAATAAPPRCDDADLCWGQGVSRRRPRPPSPLSDDEYEGACTSNVAAASCCSSPSSSSITMTASRGGRTLSGPAVLPAGAATPRPRVPLTWPMGSPAAKADRMQPLACPGAAAMAEIRLLFRMLTFRMPSGSRSASAQDGLSV